MIREHNGLTLSILERGKNGKLVKTAENDKIFLYFRTPKDLFSGKDFFKFKNKQFSVYQEHHAGTSHNSTYTFRKFKNGRWYLTEFERVRTVNNMETDMIDVVSDVKKYPKDFKKIRFEQFNPNLIEKIG